MATNSVYDLKTIELVFCPKHKDFPCDCKKRQMRSEIYGKWMTLNSNSLIDSFKEYDFINNQKFYRKPSLDTPGFLPLKYSQVGN